MIVVIIYLIIILFRQPYIRDRNDTVHMLCQIALFLIFLSCSVLLKTSEDLDNAGDIFLSIVLITIVLSLFLLCLYEALRSFREIGRAVQQECRDRSRMPSSA
eukprot:TRINITY_DN12331_c0_g1_i2.p1 TRINITY_DN12331_c0_g1~~TRINITY_DN12331_c0_g1_i2.p1  ORF type:complete len:118 (+),score=6.43 TRINITY_DN12331_c0_g1_i2:47-355(+)